MDFPSNWSIVIERKTRGSGNDLGTPKKQAATPWSFKEIYSSLSSLPSSKGWSLCQMAVINAFHNDPRTKDIYMINQLG